MHRRNGLGIGASGHRSRACRKDAATNPTLPKSHGLKASELQIAVPKATFIASDVLVGWLAAKWSREERLECEL